MQVTREDGRGGTERTVAVTSQEDGFWGNSLLRIPLLRRYTALPFVTKPAVDLDEYVTGMALDGLFTRAGKRGEENS